MTYEIPIIPGKVPPVIHVSQGDENRTVVLQITGDSIPTSVAACHIKGIRPDGAGVTQPVTYGTGTNKGLITWAVDKLFTEIDGDVICEVYLSYLSELIGTQNFILRVEKAAYRPDAPEPWSSVTITEPGTYNVRPYGEVIVDMEAGPQPEGTIEITENGEHDVAAYAAASVNVPQREEPTGTKNITTNGDYDVTEFAAAHVEVEGGAQPSGTAEITENGTHNVSEYAYADVNVQPEGETEITSNGEHDVSDYATAVVNVRPTGRMMLTENGSFDVTDAAEAVVSVPSGVTWCVTPEDYGAVGDGVTDDTAAFSQAVASGKTVVCAKTYLIDGVSAKDVDILMMQGALLKRTANGNDPFIDINPNRPSRGPVTKKSYIRGGAIDARDAEIGIAINGSEQFCIEQTEISQCLTGLYLGYPGNGCPTYNIESRVDKVKFVNNLNIIDRGQDEYANSTAIYDAGTDSQFSNIIVENFNRGMRVGGNDEISNLHHWISRDAIWDGSCTFRVDENLAGFFTDCCADSIETAFSVAPYSRCMVKGMSQVRNYLMPEKTTMYYLKADDGEDLADAAKTLWFFSYGSAHRGHPSIPTVFYEVSDNVYARYQSQGMSYDNRLVLEGAAISNMTEGGRRNIIPYGYQALGQLKNFMGGTDAFLYSFDFDDVLDNGTYSVQVATSTHGPDGVTAGASSLIVSGYDGGKMQLLVNNTEGIYYRFYNGSWQPWRRLADIVAGKVPAIYNFSGSSEHAWLMNCDLNSITTPGLYGIQTSTATNKPAAVTSGTLNLWVGGVCDETTPIMSLVQAAITKDSLFVRARSQNSGGSWVWTAWTQIGGAPDLGVLANFRGQQAKSWKDTDLNSIKDPGMYAFNPSSSAVLNKPSGLSGAKANVWVGGTPNSKSQLVLNEGGLFLRFYAANTDTWTEWTKLTS